MVDVVSKRCSHDACTRIPTFNAEGCKTPKCCKQHAKKGMVNVLKRQPSNEPSSKRPRSNLERRPAADVFGDRCSHTSCTMRSSWGSLTEGAATVCGYHKSDILGSPVINFRARCKLAGCRKLSSWGQGGEQPTHCADHGPLESGLVCMVGVRTVRERRVSSGLPHHALSNPSLDVKTECSF